MKKLKVLLIVVCLIIIACILLFIFQRRNLSEKEIIPDDFNLKIKVEYAIAPVKILTYYFYDNSIIKTDYTGGVLPSGPSITTEITKYYFDEKINLTEIRNFIDNSPRSTKEEKNAEITESNGKVYYIKFNKSNSSSILIDMGLSNEIEKITDNAIKKEVRKIKK